MKKIILLIITIFTVDLTIFCNNSTKENPAREDLYKIELKLNIYEKDQIKPALTKIFTATDPKKEDLVYRVLAQIQSNFFSGKIDNEFFLLKKTIGMPFSEKRANFISTIENEIKKYPSAQEINITLNINVHNNKNTINVGSEEVVNNVSTTQKEVLARPTQRPYLWWLSTAGISALGAYLYKSYHGKSK